MAEFLGIFRPTRPTFPGDGTPDEFEIIGRHFNYMKQGVSEGWITLVGRTQEAEDPMGLVIFEAPSEGAARAALEIDPAVVAGLFSFELRSYGIGLLKGRD